MLRHIRQSSCALPNGVTGCDSLPCCMSPARPAVHLHCALVMVWLQSFINSKQPAFSLTSVHRSGCRDRKKKPKPNRTQLTATGPSVAVASFGRSFGCRLSYFLNTQKPTKDRSQSLATGLLTVYILCTIYTVKTNIN